MTEAVAQEGGDEQELSPRERQLMYLALRSLATSLKVIGDSQRAMLARLDANHEVHERQRQHHARTMKLVQEALGIEPSARREAEDQVGGGSKASARRRAAKARPGAIRRVSGRVRRKRGRSRSAAG